MSFRFFFPIRQMGLFLALFFSLGWLYMTKGVEPLHYNHATVITPQGEQIEVEVADTEKKRRLGLGFRKELQARKGMLFVFENREQHSFWMKNMFIPLDIIWMDNHRIVHIEHSIDPPSNNQSPRPITPTQKANFVLEIPAGQAKALQLEVGQKLKYRF